MSLGSVTVSGELVPFLREGVLNELSAALEILAYQVDVAFDHETFDRALARFDEARTLLEAVGVSEPREPGAVELDLARWPRVLLAALQGECDVQARRLEARAGEGLPASVPQLRALQALAADVRRKLGAPPADAREQPAVDAGRRRLLKRSRGDE